MFDLDNLLELYLKDVEPGNNHLPEYFKAYQFVVDQFGLKPVIQLGEIQLLGWDIEYRCGAAIANFIDQILIRRLNDFVPDDDHPLILDCGANIGFSTLSYKRQFPNAKIIAFEPDPEFIPVLHHNLERNSAGDVEVVDAAVWTENGTSDWYCEGIDGSHLSAKTGKAMKTATVRTVDLGDYLNEAVDLIKMDIEGAEYEVINHIGKKLKNVKAMSIECHLNRMTIVPFSKMLRILSTAGFQLSINSFGSWRDLVRQPPILVDHYENYILVSAWRGSTPSAPTRASWVPGVGVEPIKEYVSQIRYFIHEASAHEAKLLKTTSAREAELLGYLKSYALSGVKALKRVTLMGPYQKEIGLSWSLHLGNLKRIADDGEHASRSTLLLYEDDKLLQPAHAMHEDIRNLGGGCYSHWKDMLYFSTSDGSDPNTNGRVYRIIYYV